MANRTTNPSFVRKSKDGYTITKWNQYDLKEGATASTCPKCSHTRKKKKDKCALLDWDSWIGNCNHCGEQFYLHENIPSDEDKYKRPVDTRTGQYTDNFIKYFKDERGISEETLKAFYVGQKGQDIQFNYYDGHALINRKRRLLTDKKNTSLHKDAKMIFYNLNAATGQDTVYITEGEFDALALHEAGIKNVISVPNGANTKMEVINNSWNAIKHVKTFIIAGEGDEAGLELREKLRGRFTNKAMYLDFPDGMDANDYLLKYGKDRLKSFALNPKHFPTKGVKSGADVMEEFEDFIKNGAPEGYKIGDEKFDDVFSTYLGQFITITGTPSSGKSDWVDNMVVGYNMNYGWKAAYCSPENNPRALHVKKMFGKFMGRYVVEDDLTNNPEYIAYKEHFEKNFFFINTDEIYDLETTLEIGEELIRKEGVKVFVIDPFNKIPLKGKVMEDNGNAFVREYLLKIQKFVSAHQVLVLLCAHPKKMYKDQNGNTPIPSMYDISGSSEFFNMSPHGLAVHRPYMDAQDDSKLRSVIKVLKVKDSHLGENRATVEYDWQPGSGKYKPAITDGDLPW